MNYNTNNQYKMPISHNTAHTRSATTKSDPNTETQLNETKPNPAPALSGDVPEYSDDPPAAAEPGSQLLPKASKPSSNIKAKHTNANSIPDTSQCDIEKSVISTHATQLEVYSHTFRTPSESTHLENNTDPAMPIPALVLSRNVPAVADDLLAATNAGNLGSPQASTYYHNIWTSSRAVLLSQTDTQLKQRYKHDKHPIRNATKTAINKPVPVPVLTANVPVLTEELAAATGTGNLGNSQASTPQHDYNIPPSPALLLSTGANHKHRNDQLPSDNRIAENNSHHDCLATPSTSTSIIEPCMSCRASTKTTIENSRAYRAPSVLSNPASTSTTHTVTRVFAIQWNISGLKPTKVNCRFYSHNTNQSLSAYKKLMRRNIHLEQTILEGVTTFCWVHAPRTRDRELAWQLETESLLRD